MTHRYPTRFQQEQRRVAEKDALNRIVAVAKDLLIQLDMPICFHCKVKLCTKLFNHLYENPVLLTEHLRFRQVTWNKMNEIEQSLLSNMQSLPARLTENNKYYDAYSRRCVYNLLEMMENVRTKYW